MFQHAVASEDGLGEVTNVLMCGTFGSCGEPSAPASCPGASWVFHFSATTNERLKLLRAHVFTSCFANVRAAKQPNKLSGSKVTGGGEEPEEPCFITTEKKSKLFTVPSMEAQFNMLVMEFIQSEPQLSFYHVNK